MKKQLTQRGRRGLLALVSAAAVVAAACMLALPAPAWAAETHIAHSVASWGDTTYYSTIAEAKTAGYAGATIIMDTDWDLGDGKLEIADSKTLYIDLNGHKITSSNSNSTIYLNEYATLNLSSSANATEFSYTGYDSAGNTENFIVSTGGLVTNSTSAQGTNVRLELGAYLKLDNVAVVGGGGGGVRTKKNCTIKMVNGATICHNKSVGNGSAMGEDGDGGGVFLESGSTLTMSNAHIDHNYSWGKGGGVNGQYANTITMEDGSTVSHNTSESGGGFYFRNSHFSLISVDTTGVISDNTAFGEGYSPGTAHRSGGGIHVHSCDDNETWGLIRGLTIKDNYSARDGGGLELDQENTTVKDCVITGNVAALDGGGAFVYGSGVTFDGCTVTDNYCDADNGGYEGGGIFVSYHYDLNMKGTCIVKGNTRGASSASGGNPDDVFLSTLSGGGGKAYIKGSLNQGSSVGVRTGIEDDRRIAENFSCASKDGLFMDLSGYYVSYGTDNGGDAWQRHTTKEFSVKVNGQERARYRNGAAATVVAPLTTDDSLVFWYWDRTKSTGLYPAEDYIADEATFSNTLNFTMPQNDIDLTAVYVQRAKKALLLVEKPAAGEQLSTTATLAITEGGSGASRQLKVPVSWKRLDSGALVCGMATSGTTYQATVSCSETPEIGLFFSRGISVADVSVSTSSNGAGAVAAASAAVDAAGALTVTTPEYTTEGEHQDQPLAQMRKLEVSLKGRGLVASRSLANAAVAALDDDEAGDAEDDGLVELGRVDVVYDKDADSVTIIAPHVDGFNFCYWDGTGSGRIDDEETVEIPASRLVNITSLTAVYTPVATAIEVDMDAPAAGQKLAEAADDIQLTCSDGQTGSFAEALGKGEAGFKVTWPSAAEDGVAAYGTAYTALIEVCDAGGFEGVENVMATDAVVTCGGVKATAAGFTVVDGKLCLAVTFPATAYEAAEPDDPGKTDEDEKPGDTTDDTKADETAKAEESDDAEANEPQVTTTVTTTTTVAKTAKKGTPSTGDATSLAVPVALLATSAVCLAAAAAKRRNQR